MQGTAETSLPLASSRGVNEVSTYWVYCEWGLWKSESKSFLGLRDSFTFGTVGLTPYFVVRCRGLCLVFHASDITRTVILNGSFP